MSLTLNQPLSSSLVLETSDSKTFLASFEVYLNKLLSSFDIQTKALASHVLLDGGKRIRPFLVHTCAVGKLKASNEDLLKAASVLEIVHVATLVHDDILDSAEMRRDKPTLHSLFGKQTSILLGDALFSFALELATEFSTTRICNIVSRATRKTCTGEINQNFNKENYDLNADQYFSIIQDKTGELFNASCSVGSYLAGADEELIKMVGDFGTSLGLNYQIYDDLIDTFGSESSFGKTLGTDFESGKLTLPIIRLFESLSAEKKKSLKSDLSKGDNSDQLNRYLTDLFIEYDIHHVCFSELEKRLVNSKSIASSIPDSNLSSRLVAFLSSFDAKLSKLSLNLVPNFLAIP
jgi:octaprenyl-diphosphate synthase